MLHMEHVAMEWSRVIEPLCDATKNLLKPLGLRGSDRLKLRVVGDGTDFSATTYSEEHVLKECVLEGNLDAIKIKTASVVSSYSSRAAREDFFDRLVEKERGTTWTGSWTLPITDFNIVLIATLWPRWQLDLDEEAQTVLNWHVTRFTRDTEAARDRAKFKIEHQLPDAPSAFHDHPDYPLSSYQLCASYTTINQEAVGLLQEQGTGKTPVAIRNMCCRAHKLWLKEKRAYRMLIIVPKNARMNWHDEIIKFSTIQGRIAVMRGGKMDRLKLLVDALRCEPEDEFMVIVAGYETWRRSFQMLKNPWESYGGQWDEVLLDESHYIKGTYSKRSKQALIQRDHAKFRTILTGTPVCNHVGDLWAQLEFLGQGYSGFKEENAFKNYYLKMVDQGRVKLIVGEQNMPILQERLARLCFMISKKEALPELPEKVYRIVEVEMTANQRKAYIALAQQLALEIEGDLAQGKDERLTVNNVLTKLLRLTQITSGFFPIDKQYRNDGNEIMMDRIRWFDPNPKLEALVEIIKEREENEKVLVWATFIPDIRTISARLTKEGIPHVVFMGETKDKARDEAISRFNKTHARDCKVFLGNPACCKEAINLWGYNPESAGTEDDHGCNATHAVYYSQNWSMTNRTQSEDRCHRRGTRHHVEYIDLTVPATIDEEIRARVVLKKMVNMRVQDVRDIMSALVNTKPESEDE